MLGGTLLTGGAGTVLGSLVGIGLLQVVADLVNRLGLTNSNWQSVVDGAILVVVAAGQFYLSWLQTRTRKISKVKRLDRSRRSGRRKLAS